MEAITSRENSRIKRYLRLAASPAERKAAGLFAAEGAKLCLDALKSGLTAAEIYITERALEKWPLFEDAFVVADSVAEKLSGTKTPQGVFGLFNTPVSLRPDSFSKGCYLLLDNLQDPGNLGTIIRTAEALGVSGAALCNCPDLYSPKVLRAAMGGVFRFNAWQVGDMGSEVARLRSDGVRVLAAALKAGAKTIREAGFERPCAVLLGNEGAGLSPELINACDEAVIIPMAEASPADSLCVSAAAGIFVWEMTKCGIHQQKN